MLDAALQLASRGGYDALQVRAVAERAGVSSRTIYENFSSLDALLVASVAEQSEALYGQYTQSAPGGSTSQDRVNDLIGRLTDTMVANRALTAALLRALLSGKPDIAHHIHGFREALKEILASALAVERPTEADREVAEMLESIWFAALAGWASGADPDAHIGEIMGRATRRLLPPGLAKIWESKVSETGDPGNSPLSSP